MLFGTQKPWVHRIQLEDDIQKQWKISYLHRTKMSHISNGKLLKTWNKLLYVNLIIIKLEMPIICFNDVEDLFCCGSDSFRHFGSTPLDWPTDTALNKEDKLEQAHHLKN